MRPTGTGSGHRARRGLVGVVACCLVLAACSSASPSAQGAATAAAAASGGEATSEVALQPPDVVDLTVYFRQGAGERAHLVPVSRSVPVADDLPRRALELLLAGPEEGDGGGLEAPLPTSTAVLDFAVEDEVALVDLSAEVVADRASVGASGPHELLGLSALANTLTEFPAIERVELSVEGRRHGPADGLPTGDVSEFWGWWGLPDSLARDDSVVGAAPDGSALPDAGMFRGHEQSVGADGVAARVEAVHDRTRTTWQRVSVEVRDPEGEGEAAAVPAATARRTPDGVVLEIHGVTGLGPDVALGSRALGGPPFPGLTLAGDMPGTLRITVTADEPTDFWLHTLASPTRVVLDLRK